MSHQDEPGTDVGRALDTVASALPGGGEHRPGQLEMARLVANAIEEGRHLVVQAGTGTGKSLAYLLPAVRSGRKVVIATATKALQDQLAKRDLPFLVSQMGADTDLTFAVLKGRSNYLCRQRALEVSGGGESEQTLDFADGGGLASREALWERTGAGSDGAAGKAGKAAGKAGKAEGREPSFADQVRRILAWGEQSPTGDRAELDFEPSPRAWAALSVGARECPGAFRCPSGALCFAERARALAAASDLVVVNTHLYATHVASGGAVLPEHEVLVLDEAHAVEDIMTAGLGVELSAGRLRSVALLARGLLGPDEAPLSDGVTEIAERLDDVLRPIAGKRIIEVDQTDLDRVLAVARSRLGALLAALRRTAEGEGEGGKHSRATLAASHLLEDLGAIETAGDDHVAWVEADGPSARAVTLRLAPIDVGPLLAQRLWPNVTAVLTSATVPPLLEARLGLPQAETDIFDVGSPFPYERCAMLYCPTDLPDRRSPAADDAVHVELEKIIVAAGGRTLALFTSWRAMNAAVDALRGRLEFALLAQNDLPKQKLVDAFTEEESACLFATMSFWQGVDVPGRTLSVVAIDRLPFPRPDDPLLQARRDRAGDGAFRTVDLPRAAMLLAQGAGRLIRSSTDLGMVAVLDRRLAASGYGRVLRSALPPMRFTTRRDEAMAFLSAIRSESVAQ